MSPRPDATPEFGPALDVSILVESSARPRYSTGLTALDDVTGGIHPGDLWLITAGPGQGRSALAGQLAAHLAQGQGLATYLVSDRDTAQVVTARLCANVGRIMLGHILEARPTAGEAERLARTAEQLRQSPLRIAAAPFATHRTTDTLEELATSESTVIVLDDPDWTSDWNVRTGRRLADRGAAVIASLPEEKVLRHAGEWQELKPETGLADVLLQVRHDRIDPSGRIVPTTRPGEAVITVLRNRHGPRYEFSIGFHPHWARYFDIDT